MQLKMRPILTLPNIPKTSRKDLAEIYNDSKLNRFPHISKNICQLSRKQAANYHRNGNLL